MGLPICVCPTGEVTLPDGQVVALRGLSRAEAIQVREASPNVEAMEKLILGAGLDTPPQEVDLWYATAPQNVVEQLVDAVARLSGLDGEQGKDDGGASPSESSTPSTTNSPSYCTAA